MSRNLFIVVVAATLACCGAIWYLVLNRDDTLAQAALEISPERLDVGAIGAVKISREVAITNRSANAVEITDKQTTCGCVTCNLQVPVVLEPGDTIRAEIGIDTTSLGEPIPELSKRILLLTREPDQHSYEIFVEGQVNVPQRLAVEPAHIRFGRFGNWESPTRECVVRCRDPQRLNVSLGAAANSEVDAELSETTRNEKRVYVLRIVKSNKVGPFVGQAGFRLDEEKAEITFSGERLGDVYCEAQPVVFFLGEHDKVATKSVAFRHAPSVQFDRVDGQISLGRIVSTEVESRKSDMARLRFRISVENLTIPCKADLALRFPAGGQSLCVPVFFLRKM